MQNIVIAIQQEHHNTKLICIAIFIYFIHKILETSMVTMAKLSSLVKFIKKILPQTFVYSMLTVKNPGHLDNMRHFLFDPNVPILHMLH